MTGYKTELGLRVLSLRESLCLTQERLAKMCGCNASTIGSIESGLTDPKLSTLMKLSSRLGVPLCDLLKGVSDDA